MDKYPDALRADFQRCYGLNLDDMGAAYSTLHAAALLVELPAGSRTWAAATGEDSWTRTELLLGAIADAANFMAWTKTKDAEHNRNRPKSVLPSTGGEGERHVSGMSMDPDELLNTIKRIQREAMENGR